MKRVEEKKQKKKLELMGEKDKSDSLSKEIAELKEKI